MLIKHYYTLTKTIKKWLTYLVVVGLSLIICCYLYGAKIEPNWIEIVPINLTIPHLSQAFNGFKIVQISDIHLGEFMPTQRLDKIVSLVNQQQPNAIVITGDIITKKQPFNANNVIKYLNQLNSPTGVFVVLGNHDRWHKQVTKLEQALIESKAHNLNNQVYQIYRGTDKLAIAGLDDPYVGKPDLDRVIKQLTDNSPVILLVHEPDYVDISSKTGKFALQLSGHSHGGQIKLPFLPPSILPIGGKKYFVGLNKIDNTLEYTNRGLGMTGIPIRFNSRPEITVFTLNAPK